MLIKQGVFAISDVEKESNLSRKTIGNILRDLVDHNILKKTITKGSNVQYKLVVNHKALEFIFDVIDEIIIDDIALAWDLSVSTAKKYIKQFIDDNTIQKNGFPPKKIVYTFVKSSVHDFTEEQKGVIEKYYIYTTPDGKLLKGINGFVYWAEHKSGRSDIEALAQEYLVTRKKYYNIENSVLMIDASDKLKYIFNEKVYVKKLFHRDFDALPVFGKTQLSQMIRVAKSGHTNNALMNNIVSKIQDSIDKIIDEYNIDCVGFIPPTVSRKTQLMTFLHKKLKIGRCHIIDIKKKQGLVPVQQKSLKKIEDRILNAKKTIIVGEQKKCKNILLIDDVTGSGATLNETAKKIIDQDIAQNVYAFTITGSAKSGVFDVISEA